MKSRKTKIAVILAGLVVLANSVLSVLGQQKPPTESSMASIAEVLIAEDGSQHELEYGSVVVPENRSRGDSESIQVAYVRLRCNQLSKAPPLFYLAGGPGGSGIEVVKRLVENGGDRFFDLIGSDIVGIDQRGAGMSEPCLKSDTLFEFDETQAGDRADMLEAMRLIIGREVEIWESRGVELAAYNTRESADDIDALRAQLGYSKITLWGASYGSHLAMCMMRRHPHVIHQALLTGPEGPDHTWKMPLETEAALTQLAKHVAKNAVWAEHLPDMVGTLRDLLDRLKLKPARVVVDRREIVISEFDVQRVLAQDIGTVRDGADAIPENVWRWSRENWHSLAERLIEERRKDGIGSAMTYTMDIASGSSQERAERIEQQIPLALLGDAANFPLRDLALEWPVPMLNASFREPLQSDIPVQIIVGELDARTPVSNAHEISQTLSNCGIVVVGSTGHNDVPLGLSEVKRVWSDFLKEGILTSAIIETGPIRFTIPDGLKVPLHPNAVLLSGDQLKIYAGSYRFTDGRIVTVRDADNRLILTLAGRGDFNLWAKSEGEFFSETSHIPDITFQKDDSGEVIRFVGAKRIAKKLDRQLPKIVSLSREELRALVGQFDYGHLGALSLWIEEQQLVAQLPGQPKMTLRALSADKLCCLEAGAQLSFIRNDAAEVVSLVHAQHGMVKSAARLVQTKD